MESNIVKMVESRSKKYGSREVFKYKEEISVDYKALTWTEVWHSVELTAKAILSLGYSSGSKIGIMSENVPQWTIADLGIQASKNVVVPFYPSATPEQIKFIVDHTQMKLMFVGNKAQLDSALWALKNTKSLQKIVVFKDGANLCDTRCEDWTSFTKNQSKSISDEVLKESIEGIKSDDLCTILYTSGTTGDPKGVMLEHDNFMQCFKIHDNHLNVDETDVSLCFLPISHVFERTWVYFMMHRGATTVYLENPRQVIEEIKKVKPTLMCTVPRFFEKTYDGIHNEMEKWSSLKRKLFNWAIGIGEQVTEYKAKGDPIPKSLARKHKIADALVFKKLRGIFGGNIKAFPCSGAAASHHHLKFFHATGLFINYGYGATETTATVSCFKSARFDLKSCGTIMPDLEVKFGENDEILIKGKTLFKGYYSNPEATERAFVDGWYRTGDKGYLKSSGDLVMTDRMNDIFKTSGGRFISPQKVELELLKDPFIDQVVVIGDNRKYICALIVPSFEKFRAVWKIENIDNYSNEDLVNHPRIIEFMEKRLERSQQVLPPNERVIKFKLLAEPFTIQNESLTNTLKVRRKRIEENYKALISEMYN